jgi:hypothetical protein
MRRWVEFSSVLRNWMDVGAVNKICLVNWKAVNVARGDENFKKAAAAMLFFPNDLPFVP